MPLEEFIFAARDPWGRLVVLTRNRWDETCERHPELSGLVRDLLRAVRNPTELVIDLVANEEWLCLANGRPDERLNVVVEFDGRGTGRIITAFPGEPDNRPGSGAADRLRRVAAT